VHHALIAPHCYCGPVVAAANIQLAATLPNFLILEAIKDWSGFHAQLLVKPLVLQDGYTQVPDTPGLGVELNEEFARSHPYTGKNLHLEMLEEPVSIYSFGSDDITDGISSASKPPLASSTTT